MKSTIVILFKFEFQGSLIFHEGIDTMKYSQIIIQESWAMRNKTIRDT